MKHILFKVDFEILLRKPIMSVHPLPMWLNLGDVPDLPFFYGSALPRFCQPIALPPQPPPPTKDKILLAAPGTESMTLSFRGASSAAAVIQEDGLKSLNTPSSAPCPAAT